MKILKRSQRVWIRRHKARLQRDGKFAFAGMVTALAVVGISSVVSGTETPLRCEDIETVTVIKTIIVTPTASPTPTGVPTKSPSKQQSTSGNVINAGNASYYSIDGCLGCNPGRIMANGEKLDDTKYTLAHNQIPLNTMVEVVNTRNGKSAIAKVTDRGGFNRLNRIADLSLALAKEIDLKTDIDILTITPVK